MRILCAGCCSHLRIGICLLCPPPPGAEMCLVKNGFENKRQGRKTQKLEVGCYLVPVLKGIFQRKRKILSEFFMELDEIPLTKGL